MLGIEAETVMNPEKALELIKDHSSMKGLILDLTIPGLNLEEFLDQVPETLRAHTIAFGPHVEKETLELANEKGCALVIPRSKFSAELPSLLKQYFLDG